MGIADGFNVVGIVDGFDVVGGMDKPCPRNRRGIKCCRNVSRFLISFLVRSFITIIRTILLRFICCYYYLYRTIVSMGRKRCPWVSISK